MGKTGAMKYGPFLDFAIKLKPEQVAGKLYVRPTVFDVCGCYIPAPDRCEVEGRTTWVRRKSEDQTQKKINSQMLHEWFGFSAL